MNERGIREELEDRYGPEIFKGSALNGRVLIEESEYNGFVGIEEGLRKSMNDPTEAEIALDATLIRETIKGNLFLNKELLKRVKSRQIAQLLGNAELALDEGEEIRDESPAKRRYKTNEFYDFQTAFNINSPDFFLAGITYTPEPISIVSGLPQTGKKKVALMLANYGLERGYFDNVATNIETKKFDRIPSVEELDSWLNGGGCRLFILGGADRYLGKKDRGTVIFRGFLRLIKKARDAGNKIWLIAPERPVEYRGLGKEKYGFGTEEFYKNFSWLREFKGLSPEIDDGYTVAAWIDTVGTSESLKKAIVIQAHREDFGFKGGWLLSGFIPAYDEIGLKSFAVGFREDDPCDFAKEQAKKEESSDSFSASDLEVYLDREVEGLSYGKIAKKRGIAKSTAHKKVQKVKRVRGER